MPYIIFQTIEADISLHFSCFNYHFFCVNVKIIFKTNEKVQKKKNKKKKKNKQRKTEKNIAYY